MAHVDAIMHHATVRRCVGIGFFSIILALTVEGVTRYLEDWKKGKSRVIEVGHYLILGWTDKTIPTIYELSLALFDKGGGCIVVLAQSETKQNMEKAYHSQRSRKHMRGTSVVFRRGNPLLAHDLDRVSAALAHAVIILAQSGESGRADTNTLRTCLSLNELDPPLRGHIVTEVVDSDNQALMQLVSRDKVELVVPHELVGRIMIQATRQKGLTQLYDKCVTLR